MENRGITKKRVCRICRTPSRTTVCINCLPVSEEIYTLMELVKAENIADRMILRCMEEK